MIALDLAQATRLLNPSPVLLLSTRAQSRANLMALSRYSVVSQWPPRVAISLAPCRYSRGLLEHSGDFILSVPDVTMTEEVHFCGLYSGRAIDKVRTRELATARARCVSPLQPTGCIGHLECELVERLRLGDLYVYVGEVVCALVDDEYWNGYWTASANLLFHLGADDYWVGEQMARGPGTLVPRNEIKPVSLDDPWRPSPRLPPPDDDLEAGW